MDFLIRAGGGPRRLGIFPGSFHPITRAHMAVARAALERVDEVAFVMPLRFPHKEYEEVDLVARMEIVCSAIGGHPRLSAAVTEGGLFIEIARECRRVYGSDCELWLVCGRDAAERTVSWRYAGEPIERQLQEYGLLVAGRGGGYRAPRRLAGRVANLAVEGCDGVSSTELRRRIRAGEDWEHLAPQGAERLIRLRYS